MEPQAIFWIARLTPTGERELSYAIDIARRLGRPLTVLVPELTRMLELTHGDERGRATRELESIRSYTERLMGRNKIELTVRHTDLHSFLFPKESVLVGNTRRKMPRHLSVVVPADETNIEARGSGKLCIPLGSGASGRAAIALGIPLAKKLGLLPVIFYHTTWRNEVITSPDPKEHLCTAARTLLAVAESKAREKNVVCRTIIETAPDVAEGIVRAALREHATIIFMTRSLTTGRGSYVDRVLDQSPIPVWIATREEEGHGTH